MIPKLAHFIWFGSPLPEWAQANIDLFTRINPGWSIKLWQEDSNWLDCVPEALKCLVDPKLDSELLLPFYSSRSDIISYSILNRYGGVYLDVDMVALRSLDALAGLGAYAGRQPP